MIITEYLEITKNILNNPLVKSMESFIQHSNVSCLSHSISVSYYSYRLCKLLRLDHIAVARAALLHDFFLYDWHQPHPDNKLHGFTHPGTALKNSTKHFCLNDLEKDIIVKHMWPLTVKPPKYKEAYVVCIVDKFCAVMEITGIKNKKLSAIQALPA